MDESLKCECGNNQFWSFWGYVRCPKCLNEYKRTQYDTIETSDIKIVYEYWLRRFDNDAHQYSNWEKEK